MLLFCHLVLAHYTHLSFTLDQMCFFRAHCALGISLAVLQNGECWAWSVPAILYVAIKLAMAGWHAKAQG